MKRFAILAMAALTVGACSKKAEYDAPAAGYGTLALTAECSTTVETTARARTSSGADHTGQVPLPEGAYTIPKAKELGLRIESADPTYDFLQSWAAAALYDPHNDWLWATDYIVTLFSGDEYVGIDAIPEGIDLPYFEGSARLRVLAGIEPTNVRIKARVMNTIVRIAFTDRFKGYFANGATFKLTTAAGNEFTVGYTAEDPATSEIYHYIRPAAFTISGEATKQRPSASMEAQTVKFADTVNAAPEASTLYTYTFDLSDAGSTDAVVITLNDVPIRTETIDEELNDDAKPDPISQRLR